jgi:chitinase
LTPAPPPPPPPGGGLDPPVSISNARVVEGDAGVSYAVFTLTMPTATISPVTVNYVTADPTVTQTFTATAGVDYLAQSGTVVFAPGQTRTTLSVAVLGELVPEQNETFIVRLFLPAPPGVVAKIEDPQGIATIVNDDWGRSVSGSGRLGNVVSGEGTFSLRAVEWRTRGKLSFRQGAVRFYSSGLTLISFNDVTRSATIEGTGWNAGKSVTFVLEVTDNGAGALDGFVLTLSDGFRATGPLTSGDIQYRG